MEILRSNDCVCIYKTFTYKFYKVKLGSAENIVFLLFIFTTNNQKQDFLSSWLIWLCSIY